MNDAFYAWASPQKTAPYSSAPGSKERKDAPGGFGQKAGTIPEIADGQGHTSRVPGVARGAVKRPSVVPRDVSCTARARTNMAIQFN